MAEVRVKVGGRVVAITREMLEAEPERAAELMGLNPFSAEASEMTWRLLNDLEELDRLIGKSGPREESRSYVVDGWEV